jgi:hypothetical protein
MSIESGASSAYSTLRHCPPFGAQRRRQLRAGVVVFVQHYKYSTIFHLEGLPPPLPPPRSGGLHWRDNELVPFEQSVQLAEELTRRGHPHEFYTHDGLKHYLSTSADNATTPQMFQDSLDCLRTLPAGE